MYMRRGEHTHTYTHTQIVTSRLGRLLTLILLRSRHLTVMVMRSADTSPDAAPHATVSHETSSGVDTD